jgi:hypothetical protein
LNTEKLEQTNKIKSATDFEFICEQNLEPYEILQKKYEIIEVPNFDIEEYKIYLKALEWKINHISAADYLILINNQYKPFNIIADVVLNIIKNKSAQIDSQRSVIVIGEPQFVYCIVAKLVLSGFIRIIVSLTTETETADNFSKRIKSFAFNLNLKIVPISELTAIEQAGFLLISNFEKSQNKEAYELLTYFNFLAEGAVFIDCNSLENNQLVEEARKAEIFVVDEIEILENKYKYMCEILKNSPKV